MDTSPTIFIEYEKHWRTPITLKNVKVATWVAIAGFCGVIFWVAFALCVRLTAGFFSLQFAYTCALGVSSCISITMIAGAIAGRCYSNYVFDCVSPVKITSHGVNAHGNFWPWDQIKGLDTMLLPEEGMERLWIHTKRGWYVGALTFSVDVPLLESDRVIGKLQSYLSKSGCRLNWRELGRRKK